MARCGGWFVRLIPVVAAVAGVWVTVPATAADMFDSAAAPILRDEALHALLVRGRRLPGAAGPALFDPARARWSLAFHDAIRFLPPEARPDERLEAVATASIVIPDVAIAPARPEPPAAAIEAEPKPVPDASFAAYIEATWPNAQRLGVSRRTFDAAFRGLTPDESVVALTRRQTEFVRPIWSYVIDAATPQRISLGTAAAQRLADPLGRIERGYGVPREILLAIWGMESNFGGFAGDKDIIRSLATLAFARYREEFYLGELAMALVILEEGHISRGALRGSWAGAMGHMQFMPTSFAKYAVDFDGDGRRDIWGGVTDALASAANFLKSQGWVTGLPWGVEVTVPDVYDFANNTRDFAAWTEAGFKGAGNRPMPKAGQATLFLPAGIRGPAFLVTANYDVIKKYNLSDAYALGVAHLGDRIAGFGALRRAWPTADRQLTREEREEVQTRLAALGYYTEPVDGRLGSQSRLALQRFQLEIGYRPADGYADGKALARLRQTATRPVPKPPAERPDDPQAAAKPAEPPAAPTPIPAAAPVAPAAPADKPSHPEPGTVVMLPMPPPRPAE